MQSVKRILAAGCLIGIGYILGHSRIIENASADPSDFTISEDTAKSISDAHDGLRKAVDKLKLDSRYEAVTKSINSYAVMVGGINAKEDLEAGHGVDPETFAALSVAVYQLKKHNIKDDQLADWVDTNLLGLDSNGHLTYRNKVVRLYPISKLRKLQEQRMFVLGELKGEKGSR
jgi:hypothetical protein